MGDVVHSGTATAGSATTLDDTSMVDADDSRIKGLWATIYGGTGPGQSRRASAFTPGSDRITPSPNWTTSPGTDSTYFLHRTWNPWEYTEAIRTAQRTLGDLSLIYAIDRSQVIGSPINNGMFYIWTAGASSAPDGFTLAGAGASVARARYGRGSRW